MISESELQDLLQGLDTQEWHALSKEPTGTNIQQLALQVGKRLTQVLSVKLSAWHGLPLSFDFTFAESIKFSQQVITAGCQINWPISTAQQQAVIEISNPLALQLVEQLFGGEALLPPSTKPVLPPSTKPVLPPSTKPVLTAVEQQVAKHFAMEIANHAKQLGADPENAQILPIQPNVKVENKVCVLGWNVGFAGPKNAKIQNSAMGQFKIYLIQTPKS